MHANFSDQFKIDVMRFVAHVTVVAGPTFGHSLTLAVVGRHSQRPWTFNWHPGYTLTTYCPSLDLDHAAKSRIWKEEIYRSITDKLYEVLFTGESSGHRWTEPSQCPRTELATPT